MSLKKALQDAFGAAISSEVRGFESEDGVYADLEFSVHNTAVITDGNLYELLQSYYARKDMEFCFENMLFPRVKKEGRFMAAVNISNYSDGVFLGVRSARRILITIQEIDFPP